MGTRLLSRVIANQSQCKKIPSHSGLFLYSYLCRTMGYKRRTIMAGERRSEHIGARVVLNGWIDSNRDLGGVLFFDLRDRSGKTQCIVRPTDETQFLYETARKLRSEHVVAAGGTVRRRENPNPRIPTGEI